MSTTATRRTLAEATADARAFREIFDTEYQHWEIAGSIRRQRPTVGDVEHVIIQYDRRVLDTLDELVGSDMFPGDGMVTKAVYPNGTHRWGDKYRGVMFRGFRHELFFADEQNFGNVLVIRTGPAEFSEALVTRLHRTALRQKDGYLKYADGTVFPCGTERAFFDACGMPWREPNERDNP